MPNYEDFIQSLNTTEFPGNSYYYNLVRYRNDILLDIAKTSQGVVARKLHMHHTKLSSMLGLLKLDMTLSEDILSKLDDLFYQSELIYQMTRDDQYSSELALYDERSKLLMDYNNDNNSTNL